MIKKILYLLVHSPFYPHWLEFRNKTHGNDRIIRKFYGRVLETGSGNGEMKKRALARNKKITRYIATDYTSWDKQFRELNSRVKSAGIISEFLYGSAKTTTQVDVVCSALDLPFGNHTFDVYCSFDVLEHINNPARFFQEANRILKRGGLCCTTMPFLYREHGGTTYDFQRFTRGGFKELARNNGFIIQSIFTFGFFGTTVASLSNQFIIRKIVEGNWLIKLFLLPCSPICFFIMNSIGFIIDSIDQDYRFSPYYHVVMRKANR